MLRFAALFSLALTWCLSARAEEADLSARGAGRRLAQDGVQALQQGQAEIAEQKLEKAYRLLRVPSIALWSARALAARGKLVQASERYLEAAHLSPTQGDRAVQEQAQKDAAAEAERILARLANLSIFVEGASSPELSVTLDGAPVPSALLGEEQPVDPGEHRIVARLGEEEHSERVTLAESERRAVRLHFIAQQSAQPDRAALAAARPAPASSSAPGAGEARDSRKTWAWVALAGGGAGVLVGGLSGLVALDKKTKLDASGSCKDNVCSPDMQADVDRFHTFRTLSSVGFIAGGVLGATGLVLLATAPFSARSASALGAIGVSVAVVPGAFSVRGSFQ